MRHVIACVLLVLLARLAGAGPPLFADDPQTVGPGKVEAILAVGGVGVGDYVEFAAPIADITVGLLPGLDLFVVGAPVFEFGPEEALLGNDGAFDVGFKWQPIRGKPWNAAFTPGVGLGFPFGGDVAIILPVQVEYEGSAFKVGADVGWAVVVDASDLWAAAAYGGYQVTSELWLLGEFYALRSPIDLDPRLAMRFGFDWEPALDWKRGFGFHLLASAGPRFDISGNGDPDWVAYFGLQWDICLGSPPCGEEK